MLTQLIQLIKYKFNKILIVNDYQLTLKYYGSESWSITPKYKMQYDQND